MTCRSKVFVCTSAKFISFISLPFNLYYVLRFYDQCDFMTGTSLFSNISLLFDEIRVDQLESVHLIMVCFRVCSHKIMHVSVFWLAD